MRRARVLLALATVVALALSACGTGRAGRGEPGVLPIAGAGVPASLDPQAGTTGNDYYYLNLIYDRLIRLDQETGELVPGLATSWQYRDPDKRVLELTLREGVTFQDGTPLDAEAVKFSLERFKEKGILSMLDDVQRVEVIGADRLSIELAAQSASFTSELADRAGMIVSPTAVEKYGEDFENHPVGAGPFGVVSISPGASIQMRKFEQFWEASRIRLKGFDWKIYAESTTLINALKAGEVQMAVLLDPPAVLSLRTDPTLNLSIGPPASFYYVAFNTTLPPLDRPEVRRAFNHALEREGLQQAGGGVGDVMWQPLPPSSPFFIAEQAPTWPHDPELAKRLLAEAGYPDGVSLTCLTYNSAGYRDIAPVMIQQLKRANIHLEVQTVTLAEFSEQFRKQRTYPCGLTNYGVDPLPATIIESLFTEGAYFNTGKASYGLEDLVRELDVEYDPAEQRGTVAEITRRLTETAPYSPLYSIPKITAFAKDVEGYVPSTLGYNQDLSGLSVETDSR